MTGDTTPQQQAVAALAAKFKQDYVCSGFTLSALTFGEIVDCLAEAGLLVDEDVIEVLDYVSRGRGYVGVTPYPDFTARKALGRIRNA